MITKIVKYRGFTFQYNLIQSHLEHAPMRVTYNGGIWEKKLYDIYRKLITKDDVVIDIGAYIGTHTLPFSHFAKKVYAFEANKEIYDCLKSNVELNEITNVTTYNTLLSDSNEQLSFYKRSDGTSRVSNRVVKGVCQLLQSDSLDSILDTEEKIKLIKIDVEGHEFKVLDGAKEIIAKSKPIILIEVFKHNRQQLFDWCELNKYNYTSLRGDDFLLSPITITPALN